MRIAFAALLPAVLALLGPGPATADDAAPPNVLFLAVDDLNDWVAPLEGHPQVKTPNFDRLAARGVTFANAHCQAPLCNPSRTSVLTGLRPTTTGVYALNPWFREAPGFEDHVTLPQEFMKHGYRVVTTGKIYHDAYPPRDRRGDGQEFSEWALHGGFRPRPEKRIATKSSGNPLVDWGVFPDRDENCFDYDVASEAVEKLGAAPDDKPLFLCVGFRHPHLPLYAPQSYFDRYPNDDSVLPKVQPNDRADVPDFAWKLHWSLPEPRLAWMKETDEWRPMTRGYLASISFADAMIGRVLDALEESGRAENTVIVLWSDHGYHLGEKEISGKNTLWERSAHVPLIVVAPGVEGGTRRTQPVELLDVFPTLLDLCGLPAREDIDGLSLVPLLKDADAVRERPAVTTHGPDNHTVRTDRWRYIRYGDGSQELYDMQEDPREWHNLAGEPEYADVIAELAKWIPQEPAAPAPGSRTRLLEQRDGRWYWQGEPAEGPVPMDAS